MPNSDWSGTKEELDVMVEELAGFFFQLERLIFGRLNSWEWRCVIEVLLFMAFL
jgi:hypothetical protein